MNFARGVKHGMLILAFFWWLSDRGFENTLVFCGCLVAVAEDVNKHLTTKKIRNIASCQDAILKNPALLRDNASYPKFRNK